MPRSGYYEDPIGRHFSRFYNGRGWAYIVRDEAGVEQVLYDADLNDELLKTLEAPSTPPIGNNEANFGKRTSRFNVDHKDELANQMVSIQPMTTAVIVSLLLVVILLLGILIRGSSTPSPPTDTQPSSGGTPGCRNVQATKYWDPNMFNGSGGYRTEYTCG